MFSSFSTLIQLYFYTVRIFVPSKAGERGAGAGGGGKIPGSRSAQRGPGISVKCSYIVYHRQFPEGQGPVFTNRHFVPGPVVGSRRPWFLDREQSLGRKEGPLPTQETKYAHFLLLSSWIRLCINIITYSYCIYN